MSIRGIFVVLAAILCGASVAVAVARLNRENRQEPAPEPEGAPVVVVATNVARGEMITKENIKVCRWPSEMVPEGAITAVEEALDRAALLPLVASEPLLSSKLAGKDSGRGLAALVPKGMRAYAIQVSRLSSGVAGFILPGNKVDVLLNLRNNQVDENAASTVTLLQTVEILAVNQYLDAPAENRINPKDVGSVTLLVTPEQAALLDLGQNMGQLTLSLRNPDDGDRATASPATLAGILPMQEKPKEEPVPEPVKETPPPPPPAPVATRRPPSYEVVTLRGADRGTVVFTEKQ